MLLWASRSGRFFGAKLLRTGATARTAALSGGEYAREPPHFYRTSKNGYPGRCHRLHSCRMFPRVRSGHLHEKRLSRPGSSKELYKKGKEPAFRNFKIRNYESEENDNRGGKASRHQPLSELPQDRKCQRHEMALLWSGLPFGTLW